MITALTFAASLLAVASPHGGSPCSGHVLLKQTASAQTISKLEKAWSHAYYSGDVAFLECLYDASFQSVGSDGSISTRADDIASSPAAAKRGRHKNVRIVSMNIIMRGSVAVAGGVEEWTNASKGLVRMHWSDVYEFDGGQWHAVFSQDTKLLPSRP